jgi:DNA-binding PadR family transcriptional regulator
MADGGVAYVILGALRHGPKSGYEIKKLVDKATRFFWAASYGQIYPELRRLQEQGLIETSDEQVGGRRRVRYRLTRAGRAKLVRWLREPAAGYELRDEGLLKLFFADALSADEALELVRAFRREREAILEKLRAIDVPSGKGQGSFPLVVLSYGIEFHEWVIGWCSRLERRLEKATAEQEVS